MSGALLNNSKFEENATQIAYFAQNKTTGSEYLSFFAEEKKQNTIAPPTYEFLSTYGAFRETKVCFAGTVNANKKNDIKITNLQNNESLSFLYAPTFSNIEYKGHYKHEFYPLELLFKGNHSYGKNFLFCYISETHAKNILAQKGLEPSMDAYESLLGETITISVDGTDYLYSIGNIYLETNYFYEGLTEVMGSFILTPSKMPNQLKCQALYFMRKYAYQNEFYMRRIKSMYDKNHHNIVK